VGLADRVGKVAANIASLTKDRYFKRRVSLDSLERLVELDIVRLGSIGDRSLIVAISILLFSGCSGGLVLVSVFCL